MVKSKSSFVTDFLHKCYQNAFLLYIILAFLFTDPVDELLPREGNDIFISTTSFRGAAEPVWSLEIEIELLIVCSHNTMYQLPI